MKTIIVAMFVSLVSVFASVAMGSTLRPGTYYVDQVEGGIVGTVNVRTLETRTVHVSYTVHEGATLIVCAPLVVVGHVDVVAFTDSEAGAIVGHARTAYRGEGRKYVGGIVRIGSEIGTHGTWTDTTDVVATDAELVATRCESVGPRLDGTFATICDGIVVSVDDGHTAHLMPFGTPVAGNEQIGARR